MKKFVKRYSNCCTALPVGEISKYSLLGERVIYLGFCSKCKDGAEFLTEKQLEKEENSHASIQ